MPVDMMLEAMKVVYTKSMSGHSRSSMFSRSSSLPRGSQYGFFGSPSSSSHSTCPSLHAVSEETTGSMQSDNFLASYAVKYYGSSTVRHYSDFGGCQMVMDRMLLKNRSLTSSLIHLASSKRAPRSSHCILMFSAHDMKLFSNDKRLCMEKLPLDCVYAVHPHPTKDKYFGILADHPSSGTVHCYCYAAKQPVTSIDILCGFREACMHWLERNLSEPEAQQDEGNPGNSKKKAKCSMSSPDILAECHKKLSDRWTLDYVTSICDSEDASVMLAKNSLRKVSFAPCEKVEKKHPRFSVKVVKDESVEMPSSSSSAGKEAEIAEMYEVDLQDVSLSEDPLAEITEMGSKEVTPQKSPYYYSEPKLPSRDFSPPSPPPDLMHYTRPSHPDESDLMDRQTQSEDDYLSYHIKKKLLALKLHEKSSKKKTRARLSSPASSTSDNWDILKKGKKLSKRDCLNPIFHSTPDVDILTDDSNPSDYYTPKQSLQDFKPAEKPLVEPQDDAEEAVAHGEDSDRESIHSVSSSCSAPSFLISSSTQLCQCIGEKDLSPNYKSLLDQLAKSVENTGGFFSTSRSKPTACSKDISSSCLSPISEPSLCPKDISSSFISTPVSKFSVFSKEISSSNESSPESDGKNFSSPKEIPGTNETEVSPQGSKLCVVDEAWWKQFEGCFSDDAETDCESKPDGSQSSTENPVLRRIELDELLNRLYPDTNLEDVDQADEEVEPPQLQNAAIESDKIVDDDELEDLTEVLDKISAENVTTYAQEEMSLECSDESKLLDLSQSPQHVSIDIPEDLSLGFDAQPDASKQPGLIEKFSDAFGEFVCASNLERKGCNSKENLATEASQGWSGSPSADLIDINFEDEKEHNSSKVTKPWPPAPQDWPDVSTDELLFARTQEEANLLGLKEGGENKSSTPLSISPEPTCQSTGDDLSMRRRLSVGIKKNPQNTTKESASCEESANSSISSFTMSSLSMATDILEKSHDSLAKSVHDLCQRAIIKQSNISLELVLPSDKLQIEKEGDKSYDSKVFGSPSDKSSMLSIQLNSSIMYSPSDGENSKIF